jgi:PTS system galactitol-specific IIB component
MTGTKKNILVVCGTSVATSTVVAEGLKEELPEHGVEIGTISKAKASEARGKVSSGNYDIIVATTQMDQSKFDIPIVKATSFMTGIGKEDTIEEIAEILKNS